MSFYYYSPRAKRDLVDIYAYLALRNVSAMIKLRDKIDRKLTFTARFPELSEACPELRAHLRKTVVHPYLIFYYPREDGIEVVRILHGKRNVKKIFRQ